MPQWQCHHRHLHRDPGAAWTRSWKLEAQASWQGSSWLMFRGPQAPRLSRRVPTTLPQWLLTSPLWQGASWPFHAPLQVDRLGHRGTRQSPCQTGRAPMRRHAQFATGSDSRGGALGPPWRTSPRPPANPGPGPFKFGSSAVHTHARDASGQPERARARAPGVRLVGTCQRFHPVAEL